MYDPELVFLIHVDIWRLLVGGAASMAASHCGGVVLDPPMMLIPMGVRLLCAAEVCGCRCALVILAKVVYRMCV